MGRWFTAEEDQPGGPKLVVAAHDFWMSRLNADPGIVGRTLTLDGEPYEVVGVMPAGFSHRRAEVFVPIQRRLDPATRGSHFLSTYARLKKDVPIERATSEVRSLGAALAREFGHNHGMDVQSLYEATVGNVRTPLEVLLGAVFLVLLIACSNVANLLLAAGVARRRELAIRLALGARPRDLARQLTIESVVLALAGGVLGADLLDVLDAEPGGRLVAAVVHPINSAGRFASKDPDAPFVIESYLERRVFVDQIERAGLPMTFHQNHFVLEDYSLALEGAGFLLERVREVYDDQHPRWRRVPLFLHLLAVKR
jgi:hypothetical protein